MYSHTPTVFSTTISRFWHNFFQIYAPHLFSAHDSPSIWRVPVPSALLAKSAKTCSVCEQLSFQLISHCMQVELGSVVIFNMVCKCMCVKESVYVPACVRVVFPMPVAVGGGGCVCVFACAYGCVFVCVYACIWVCVVSMFACAWSVSVPVIISVCLYVCVCVCVCASVCVWCLCLCLCLCLRPCLCLSLSHTRSLALSHTCLWQTKLAE